MIVFEAFKLGLNYFFRKKINLVWGIIPVFLGVILYISFGAWAFSMLQMFSQDIIKFEMLSTWAKGFTFASIGLVVGVVLYFLFNWAFLICVFFLSYPFHHLICTNTEKEMGITLSTKNFSLKSLIGEFYKVLLNLFLTLAVISFALFPIFSLMAIAGTAILASIQFLDYTWSRNNLTFEECFLDLKKHFINYLGMGLIAVFLMAIPVVNLMFLPVLVSIYSVMFYKQKGQA